METYDIISIIVLVVWALFVFLANYVKVIRPFFVKTYQKIHQRTI